VLDTQVMQRLPDNSRYLDDARIWDSSVIASRETPVQPTAGICVLRGTLAPRGAFINPPAASPRLLRHRGPVAHTPSSPA
jgi:dihydroxyacid dehydratase/phosphogluconate dehydratase